jgi:tRNA(fMet)-specific endonuclease VapC
MIYLPDSNVWVQFLRNRHALVVQRIRAHQPAELRVCSVVKAELNYGCLRSAKAAIGPYDLQIAAIARTNGFTLVTHNTSEFGRVPGLLVEDWELP